MGTLHTFQGNFPHNNNTVTCKFNVLTSHLHVTSLEIWSFTLCFWPKCCFKPFCIQYVNPC